MNTSPSDFKTWYNLLPTDLWLIPIRSEGKAPDCKGSWKDEENRMDYEKALWRIENGYNVGFSPRGEIAVMDIDNPEKALDYLPDDITRNTLLVESRSGKPHIYFLNDMDIENKDITNENGEIVEIRTTWRYVLVPGSYVPSENSDGLYKVVNAEKPNKLSNNLPKDIISDKENESYDTSTPEFDGEWLSLPCVRKIYKSNNLPDNGKRRKAGKILSMAWFLDGKDEGGFRDFIRPFVEKNRHGHNHKPKNYNWIPTIKRRGMDWSCGEIRNWLSKVMISPCGHCPLEREEFEVGE